MKKLLILLLFIYLTIFTFFLTINVKAADVQLTKVNIYDNKNKLIYTRYNNYITYIPIKELKHEIIDCFLLVEDRYFYVHNGFNFSRIIQSFFSNFSSDLSGGSTITQQLSRTMFLNNEQSLERKLLEMKYSIDLENEYSKMDILDLYLNNLYFGHNIYGIYQASFFYFNKHPNNLSIGEISLLVGIIKGPSIYSPINNYDKAMERKNVVLRVLLSNNYIAKKQYYEEKKDLDIYGKDNLSLSSSTRFYIDYVLGEIRDLKINYPEIDVYTAFDSEINNKIDALISSSSFDSEISVVILEPNSFNVISIIGSKDYSISSYNRALLSSRQIGSTVKPFLYYQALQEGFEADTRFISEKTTFYVNGKEYTPKNFLNRYKNNYMTLAEAIATSDNIYAVKAHLFIGMDRLPNILSSLNIVEKEISPLVALGTTETSLLKITNAYNSLASNGLFSSPNAIIKINSNNQTIYSSPVATPLLNKNSTFIISDLLTGIFDQHLSSVVTGKRMSLNHRYAAKTGSTNTDSYMIGFSPFFTLGIWMGYDDNTPMNSSNVKSFWEEIANSYGERFSDIWYKMPDDLEIRPIKITDTYIKNLYFKKKYPLLRH